MKKLLILLSCLLLITGCSQEKEDDEENKINVQEFSNRISLFNIIEDQIELIEKKDYIKADEELEDVFLKSNQVGYTYSRSNDNSNNYIKKLNKTADSINNASTMQKRQKIGFEAKKSELRLESQASEQKGEDSGSKEATESDSKPSPSGKSDGAEGEEIVLYEEKLTEEYPEAAMTDEDFNILDQSISLLAYITEETLSKYANNEKAIINREKYLFYAIESYSRNGKYSQGVKLIDELLENWQQLSSTSKSIEPENQKTIISTIQNIENAMSLKDYVAIKFQCKSAISELEKILTKPDES